MKTRLAFLILACAVAGAAGSARADLLIYKISGGSRGVILQGEAKVNPGGTVSFIHPKFGSYYFSLETAEIIDAPTTMQVFRKMLTKAKALREPDPQVKA